MSPVQSSAARRARGARWLEAALTDLRPQARELLGTTEAEAFLSRLELHHLDAYEPLEILYGSRLLADETLDGLLRDLLTRCLDAAAARPGPLRARDRRREIDPGWFQRSRLVGYVCYVDRFAGTLAGLRGRLDYLGELDVTYLHLMPLLRPRDGENDGGYAVADYRAVDPRLGHVDDLEALAADLHSRDISLCIDLVCNHTAREHPWARAAASGDPAYRDFYLVHPDRTLPDAYEATLPEVFPDTAPGSFTYEAEMRGWVWTTFHDYQWDLNYANPRVFAAMLDTMLHLGNRGVDVLRLDAVPFLWKRLGTTCQDQPEVHLLLQAFRALTRVAMPGLAFKAEAIVSPDDLVKYLGAHDRVSPECDLAYHNQLMVMLWSSLATRDARLATAALSRMRPVPAGTAWVTYVRCHDDIGWAVSDGDASAVGWDGPAHRRFLNDFFAGRFPGSYARGALFQEDEQTGDARISGMTASLCGIDAARAAGDEQALDAAVRRLVLLYSVVFSFGGIPLVYAGDEIALGNDPRWAADPAHAGDNRWMHRPRMDWAAAGRRHDRASVEGRVFTAFRALAEARRGLLALRASSAVQVLTVDDPHVLAYRRRHPRSTDVLVLVNLDEEPRSVDATVLATSGVNHPVAVHSSGEPFVAEGGRIHLPALGFLWLVDDPGR